MYQKIKKLINESKNLIVFTGAGISTNSGIPDFRSKGGLYEMVGKEYTLPYPEAIFDIDYFRKNPKPFYNLSRNLLSEQSRPTACHKLLARLEQESKVSLVITQNIDHLHQKAGSQNVMECHGTYETGHCLDCRKEYLLDDYKTTLLQGDIPYCKCGGYIKPDIVFFGEQLPSEFYSLCKNPPFSDLILIMGTSLKVQPAAGLALMIAEKVPSIFVNRDATEYDNLFDYVIHDDLDVFTGRIEKILN